MIYQHSVTNQNVYMFVYSTCHLDNVTGPWVRMSKLEVINTVSEKMIF